MQQALWITGIGNEYGADTCLFRDADFIFDAFEIPEGPDAPGPDAADREGDDRAEPANGAPASR